MDFCMSPVSLIGLGQFQSLSQSRSQPKQNSRRYHLSYLRWYIRCYLTWLPYIVYIGVGLEKIFDSKFENFSVFRIFLHSKIVSNSNRIFLDVRRAYAESRSFLLAWLGLSTYTYTITVRIKYSIWFENKPNIGHSKTISNSNRILPLCIYNRIYGLTERDSCILYIWLYIRHRIRKA
jgi:hypothetical protein